MIRKMKPNIDLVKINNNSVKLIGLCAITLEEWLYNKLKQIYF